MRKILSFIYILNHSYKPKKDINVAPTSRYTETSLGNVKWFILIFVLTQFSDKYSQLYITSTANY